MHFPFLRSSFLDLAKQVTRNVQSKLQSIFKEYLLMRDILSGTLRIEIIWVSPQKKM